MSPETGTTPPGATESSAGLRTLVIGKIGTSAADWPLYVGQEEICADYGIQLEYINAGSSSASAQQLAAGSVGIAGGGLPDFIRATNAGAPIQLVATGVARPPYSIIVQDSITSWEELAGQPVIIGGENDITLMYFNAAAEANGLSPNDVQFTYAGSTADRFAALVSGSVAAAILLPPFNFRAVSEGYRDLGTVAQHLPDSPFTGYHVNTAWAQENEELLVDFLGCYLESIEWLRDPGNRERAIEILAETTNSEQADAESTYDYYIDEIDAFPAGAMTSEDAFNALLESLAESGLLEGGAAQPMSAYVDYSYLEAAASSG